jgi:hypothetical protein
LSPTAHLTSWSTNNLRKYKSLSGPMAEKERIEKTKTETDDEGNTTTETEVKEETEED